MFVYREQTRSRCLQTSGFTVRGLRRNEDGTGDSQTEKRRKKKEGGRRVNVVNGKMKKKEVDFVEFVEFRIPGSATGGSDRFRFVSSARWPEKVKQDTVE